VKRQTSRPSAAQSVVYLLTAISVRERESRLDFRSNANAAAGRGGASLGHFSNSYTLGGRRGGGKREKRESSVQDFLVPTPAFSRLASEENRKEEKRRQRLDTAVSASFPSFAPIGGKERREGGGGE